MVFSQYGGDETLHALRQIKTITSLSDMEIFVSALYNPTKTRSKLQLSICV